MNSVVRNASFLAALIAGVVVAGTTGAREIERDAAWVSNRTCYIAKRVPARIVEDTRGELVAGPTEEWKGNPHRPGSRVVQVINDPVYITKTTVVERQHVTLREVGCRR